MKVNLNFIPYFLYPVNGYTKISIIKIYFVVCYKPNLGFLNANDTSTLKGIFIDLNEAKSLFNDIRDSGACNNIKILCDSILASDIKKYIKSKVITEEDFVINFKHHSLEALKDTVSVGIEKIKEYKI